MNRHFLLGVRIDDLSEEELPATLSAWLSSVHDKSRVIFTINPEFLLMARALPAFRDLLNQSNLSLPDGVGLRFALAALGDTRLDSRHTGVDVLLLLAQLCASVKQRLVLYGGRRGSAAATACNLRAQWPMLDVVAIDPSLVPPYDWDELATQTPAVLAVALGQNKQERFINEAVQRLASLRIAIGVGGAFDTLSGYLPRAPLLWQQRGLEWLWRLRLEPQRILRISRACIVFPWLVARATIQQRRFIKACRAVISEIFQQLFIRGSRDTSL